MLSSNEWKVFYDEGRAFHKTAKGGLRRPEVFTPVIIQNIAAMAIEKYFMAIFTRRGLLPRNHTLGDLLEEAKNFMSLPVELEETLRYMDSLQNICSVVDFKITRPKAGDAPRFIEAADTLALLVERELAACAG
jgi:HEPN domain-containing protein